MGELMDYARDMLEADTAFRALLVTRGILDGAHTIIRKSPARLVLDDGTVVLEAPNPWVAYDPQTNILFDAPTFDALITGLQHTLGAVGAPE